MIKIKDLRLSDEILLAEEAYSPTIASGTDVDTGTDEAKMVTAKSLEDSSYAKLGETSATAYRGDRGKTAYGYSQIGHLPLAGGVLTGNLGTSSELIPTEEAVEHTGQSTIILDASSVAVSANIADGGSYTNMILFVICVDVTNGASLLGTIQGGTDYAFTAAGECLILKQTATFATGWWIVGKYTP